MCFFTSNHISLPLPTPLSICQAAFSSLPGCKGGPEDTESLFETRYYYVNVEKCLLELVIRPVGATYRDGGESTHIKSWSMRYTKTRRRPQARSPPLTVVTTYVIYGRSSSATIGKERRQTFSLLFMVTTIESWIR